MAIVKNRHLIQEEFAQLWNFKTRSKIVGEVSHEPENLFTMEVFIEF